MARVQVFFNEPSRTKQSFKKETDINHIMKKFKKVVGVDYLDRYNAVASGKFGDFANVPDYRTALDQVRQADEIFMNLPAEVRKRFSNDTAEFLDYVSDPAHQDELVQMGLVEPKAKPVVDVTTPLEEKSKEGV